MKQDHDEDGLEPEAAAFLDSVRGLDQPTARDRHRVRRRVLAAVAATGAATAAGGTATTAAAATAGTAAAGGATAGAGVIGTTLAAKVWIGVAIGLVGAGVAGGVATLGPSDEEAVVASAEPTETADDRPTESAPESEFAPESESEPELGSESESVPEAEPELTTQSDAPSQSVPHAPAIEAPASSARQTRESPNSPVASPRPEAMADADTLAAELGLIRRAHAAANAGNHTEALAILDEHSRRFPSGSLAVEREGARAISLCGAGRRAAGREVAERFLRAHPGSPLRGRVSRACAE